MQKHGQPRVFVVNFEQIPNYEKQQIIVQVSSFLTLVTILFSGAAVMFFFEWLHL